MRRCFLSDLRVYLDSNGYRAYSCILILILITIDSASIYLSIILASKSEPMKIFEFSLSQLTDADELEAYSNHTCLIPTYFHRFYCIVLF